MFLHQSLEHHFQDPLLRLLLIGTFITRTWSLCDYFKPQGHRGRGRRGGTRDRLRERERRREVKTDSHIRNYASTVSPLHSSPKSTCIHPITSPSNDLYIYDFEYYLSYSWILKMLRMALSNLCFDNYIKARSKCIKTGLVAPWQRLWKQPNRQFGVLLSALLRYKLKYEYNCFQMPQCSFFSTYFWVTQNCWI